MNGSNIIRYDLMIEEALRGVVREAISQVAKDGLRGEHHFYITFLTTFAGVQVPDYILKQHQDEMTIVLQYQFFGLRLENDAIHVMLSFNGKQENIVVPIESITTFADPSVNFVLQFQMLKTGISHKDKTKEQADAADTGDVEAKDDIENAKESAEDDKKRGEVIRLDKFRKK